MDGPGLCHLPGPGKAAVAGAKLFFGGVQKQKMGLKVWGLGLKVWGLGFRVEGLGFRVEG